MFATPAYAQATAPAAGAPQGGPTDAILQFAPLVVLFALFYLFLIRPQQRRAKQHAATVQGVKRGDNVVLSSGLMGRVTRVDDAEVMLEIAPKVEVKVVKSMISDVRARSEPVASNDAKA